METSTKLKLTHISQAQVKVQKIKNCLQHENKHSLKK